MDLREHRQLVYTAQSKHLYFAKVLISRYVIESGFVPLNPFCAFGYFLFDNVPRNDIRNCNNNLIRIADETWTFGPIANGVWDEICLARELNKPIRLYSAGSNYADIRRLSVADVAFEAELCEKKEETWLRRELTGMLS